MIKELAKKGHPCGVCRIVTVVWAELGLGDQPNRSDFERVESVHHSAWSAAFDQRLTKFLARLSKWREVKQPNKPLGTTSAVMKPMVILPGVTRPAPTVAGSTTTSTAPTNTITTAIPVAPQAASTAVLRRFRTDDCRCDHHRSNPGNDCAKKPSSRFRVRCLGAWGSCRFD